MSWDEFQTRYPANRFILHLLRYIYTAQPGKQAILPYMQGDLWSTLLYHDLPPTTNQQNNRILHIPLCMRMVKPPTPYPTNNSSPAYFYIYVSAMQTAKPQVSFSHQVMQPNPRWNSKSTHLFTLQSQNYCCYFRLSLCESKTIHVPLQPASNVISFHSSHPPYASLCDTKAQAWVKCAVIDSSSKLIRTCTSASSPTNATTSCVETLLNLQRDLC